MRSIELTEAVAKALKAPAGADPFNYVCNLSLADLEGKLEAEKLSGLIAPLWSAIEKLRDQSAATGAALNAKFAAEGDAVKGEMGFGGVEQFYGGVLHASSSPVSVARFAPLLGRTADAFKRPCPVASFASPSAPPPRCLAPLPTPPPS